MQYCVYRNAAIKENKMNHALECYDEFESIVRNAVTRSFIEEPNDAPARWMIIRKIGLDPLYNCMGAWLGYTNEFQEKIKEHMKIAMEWNEENDLEGVKERIDEILFAYKCEASK